MLGSDLAMALDPVLLMRRVGIEPDPWQLGVLRSRASRVLLNCCRQSGKSTTVAGLALHTAIYEPGSLSLILSPGERQSKEMLRKVMDMYHELGRPVRADVENRLELELANGSRIVALPGVEGTIRGYSGVRLLLIDEASRVLDPLYTAVRPMLAVSGGRLVSLSTPFGMRGWWHREWTEGEGWERVKVDAYQCPRISPTFLEEERRSMPVWEFNQEYLCAFEQTLDNVFTYEEVMGMFSPHVQPFVFEEPACTTLD